MSRISVRYIIDDVPAATRFYTTFLGFSLEQDALPAFASVTRDGVRLLLSVTAARGSVHCQTVAGRNRAAGTVSIYQPPRPHCG